MLHAGVGMLGKFISVREPNIKYLGLENMVRLAEVPAVSEAINRRAGNPKTLTRTPQNSHTGNVVLLLLYFCCWHTCPC